MAKRFKLITGSMSRAVTQAANQIAEGSRTGQSIGMVSVVLEVDGTLRLYTAGKFERDTLAVQGALIEAVRGLPVSGR